jgi:hypothetical protein
MSLVRKLKPDRSITGAVAPLSLLLIFGITALAFGLSTGLVVLAALLWVVCLFYLYAFARTGNLAQLAVFADGAFFGFMVYIAARQVGRLEFALAYFLGLLFFAIVLGYLALTRRLKWRGREVFELAAEAVEEEGNGYTARPRPVGKVAYSPQQMRDFARYMARHLIALPYRTSQNITLVPIKMGEEYGRLLGLSGDYRDATWVNFDANGEVSVHIAHKDYLDYRQPLAFDPLCASLGQVFIEFCELINKGEGVRIIDRMDDLRIGILS